MNENYVLKREKFLPTFVMLWWWNEAKKRRNFLQCLCEEKRVGGFERERKILCHDNEMTFSAFKEKRMNKEDSRKRKRRRRR
jgi:hypothetical protein